MSSAANNPAEIKEMFIPEGVIINGALTAPKGVPVRVAGTLSLGGDLVAEGLVVIESTGIIDGQGVVKAGGLVIHGAVRGVPLDVDGVLDVHGTGAIDSPRIEYVDISLTRGSRIKGPMSPRSAGASSDGAGAPAMTSTSTSAPGGSLPRLVANHPSAPAAPAASAVAGEDSAGKSRSSLGQALSNLIGPRDPVAEPTSPDSLGDMKFGVDAKNAAGSLAVAG